MMHFASLFFGTSVIAIAFGLESHRRLHDRAMKPASQVDREYFGARRRYRLWTNWLIGLIGALAASAGLVGQGPIWIVLWALIPVFVVAITVLALTDAFTTSGYLSRKLPELQAQTLGTARASVNEKNSSSEYATDAASPDDSERAPDS